MEQPGLTVAEIDAEIVKLTARGEAARDQFTEALRRIRVDELLEQRQLLTDPPEAA